MLTIGPVTFDFTPLLAVADDPVAAAWFLLSNGGWVFVLAFFLWMTWFMWKNYSQNAFLAANLRPVLLAIDVPKRSIQTPKAVENIFSHLAGAHGTHNRREKYLHGKAQEWFALEIVSIDGYVQFLVWTWDKYRDLVETAIYAQYPDAQITEVEDYTKNVPLRYPNPEWDFWGTDFVFVKDQAYPLRSWEEFEHKGQKDEPFKDPLAAMLENMARLVPGEQLWLQIIIRPIEQKKWQAKAEKVVKKFIGAKVPVQQGLFSKALDLTGKAVTPALDQVFGKPEAAPKKKDELPSRMLHMSPGERLVAEAIDRKISKIGFDAKVRVVYVARREVFKKQHGAHAVIGAIKQFNTNDRNSLKPELKRIGPGSLWLFKDRRNNWRKRKLAFAYRGRSIYRGAKWYVLNIEELASLWHFPTAAVHAPLIMTTDAKRAVAPASLPIPDRSPTVRPMSARPPAGPPTGLSMA